MFETSHPLLQPQKRQLRVAETVYPSCIIQSTPSLGVKVYIISDWGYDVSSPYTAAVSLKPPHIDSPTIQLSALLFFSNLSKLPTPPEMSPPQAFLIASTTYIMVLSLTTPRSLYRPVFFPLMLLAVSFILTPSSISSPTTSHPPSNPLYTNILAGSVFSFTLHYIDSVLLSAWSYDNNGPTSARGGHSQRHIDMNNSSNEKMRKASGGTDDGPGVIWGFAEVFRRLWWGFAHVWDTRYCGQVWEVRNVPSFPGFASSTPQRTHQVPSRKYILLRNSMICIVCIVLLDLSHLLTKNGDLETNKKLFAEDRVPIFRRLGDVKWEGEVGLRVISMLFHWGITYVLFQAVYSGCAVVAIGGFRSWTGSWKPLFGEVGKSWSIRMFWGWVVPYSSLKIFSQRFVNLYNVLQEFLAPSHAPDHHQSCTIPHVRRIPIPARIIDRSLLIHPSGLHLLRTSPSMRRASHWHPVGRIWRYAFLLLSDFGYHIWRRCIEYLSLYGRRKY